ncbi:MAG: ion transporter [Thermosynechococcaceae cyanobacterium MS004]|nr:ion transporter [Thermosynechococcaceae cyanobacterium MS004]
MQADTIWARFTTKLESLRVTIGFYLDDIQTPIGVAIDLAIAQLVLTSTGIFVAQTYALPEKFRLFLDGLNAVILWIFVAEYVLRLWCAKNRLRYIFSLYAVIDFMTILPFVIGVFDVSFIRIFRWFRILRLVRFLEGQTLWGSVRSTDGPIFVRILFTLFTIIFVYSGLIYQVEHSINPQGFGTFLDAFYFSVVTMTTVGFGDIAPITEAGRLLTVLMIVTGVALIPWQVGDIVRRLVKSAAQVELPCPGCGLILHDRDAQHCKRCGAALQPQGESLNA